MRLSPSGYVRRGGHGRDRASAEIVDADSSSRRLRSAFDGGGVIVCLRGRTAVISDAVEERGDLVPHGVRVYLV